MKKNKTTFTKVSFKDKNLLHSYATAVAIISSLVSMVSFCIPPSDENIWKIVCTAIFVIILSSLFIIMWYRANNTDHADLKINGTKVNIKIGNLFEEEGIKVIGVNNYIDLVADDIVVSKATLHGKFVIQHQKEIDDIKAAIKKSNTLIPEKNSDRYGWQSYDYGSCVLYGNYVLTVLTKFNKKNMAYTSIEEYIQFWMTFWKNIDALYSSKTVNIPIMGAGQTRFKGDKPRKQELLEIALWTLEKSRFCNSYADKAINFVIYEGDAPEIDFYRIQKRWDKI